VTATIHNDSDEIARGFAVHIDCLWVPTAESSPTELLRTLRIRVPSVERRDDYMYRETFAVPKVSEPGGYSFVTTMEFLDAVSERWRRDGEQLLHWVPPVSLPRWWQFWRKTS
jgi:hypothetical protein